jgi:hypothetical protein
MRGFPPLQIFLLGLAFGLLAVPLALLTGAGSHPGSVVQAGDEHPEGGQKHAPVPALLRLRFAHQPLAIHLKQEGRELLTQLDLKTSPAEARSEIEVSHDGNELELSATWPPGTPDTALTLEIELDGFETRRETRWSDDAALTEILTFIW